jgi:hypothetical protein
MARIIDGNMVIGRNFNLEKSHNYIEMLSHLGKIKRDLKREHNEDSSYHIKLCL